MKRWGMFVLFVIAALILSALLWLREAGHLYALTGRGLVEFYATFLACAVLCGALIRWVRKEARP
jgi:hypothetical protein